MIPHFDAMWGLKRADEARRLGTSAQAILRVLRREWEMGTADLREESGVTDRKAFTRGIDELQAAMLVVPSEVLYRPKFTYIWTLGVGRFPDALRRRAARATAVKAIARCFLDQRRDDRAGRARARHRAVASRSRARQPRARRRGFRRNAVARNLQAQFER